jgi:hypothetical protein
MGETHGIWKEYLGFVLAAGRDEEAILSLQNPDKVESAQSFSIHASL